VSNRLLNFKHSDKSKTHIRIIDEIPEVLFDKLEQHKNLQFGWIEEPEFELADEQTTEFKEAFAKTKESDETYFQQREKLGSRVTRRQIAKLDRALKVSRAEKNQTGGAEQWIKEGKQATHWTRLSCHRFRPNEARLQLSLRAYNLCNLWRRLVLPKRIDAWSLTGLRERLVKTGGRLIKHAGYYWLLLAESHVTRRLFGQMLRRISALTTPSG